MKTKLNKKVGDFLIVFLVLIMISLVVVGFIIRKNKETKTNESKKQAMYLIHDSLEFFYEEHGIYPKNLEELELGSIPTKYEYIYIPNHNFQMYALKIVLENPKKTDANVYKKNNVWYYKLNSLQ